MRSHHEEHSHGNRLSLSTSGPPIDVRKVPADSVPYGESISRNGKSVWAAFGEDGSVVCVAATAEEARSKYRKLLYGNLLTTKEKNLAGGS